MLRCASTTRRGTRTGSRRAGGTRRAYKATVGKMCRRLDGGNSSHRWFGRASRASALAPRQLKPPSRIDDVETEHFLHGDSIIMSLQSRLFIGLGTLASLGVLATGFILRTAMLERAQARRYEVTNRLSASLSQAAGLQAVERGVGNTILGTTGDT